MEHAPALVEHAPGFSGVGGGGVLEPWENSGRISSSPQNSESCAGNSGIFWEFCIIRPTITTREWCQVTQPRARINVSCSRADHKGGTGGLGDQKRTTKRVGRGCEGSVPDLGTGTWTRDRAACEGKRRLVPTPGTGEGRRRTLSA